MITSLIKHYYKPSPVQKTRREIQAKDNFTKPLNISSETSHPLSSTAHVSAGSFFTEHY